ncbi:MAG TPA: amino acid ABC transporter permease [Spirochaetota bacterium]|nr:amino acid ABC transporter permease [Spirochaetota bacterium]
MRNRIRFTLLDFILLSFLLTGALFVVFRMRAELHYEWDWSAVASYIVRYDTRLEEYVPGLLLSGLAVTFRLSVWSTILASQIGLVMGLMRISHKAGLKLTSALYVGVVRNIPSIVFIFIFYFFISGQIADAFNSGSSSSFLIEHNSIVSFFFSPLSMLSVFISAVFTLALYEGAYMTEIVRAGIESVEKGQGEAADALGFSWYRKMRHIILPQAFKRILPPMAGQIISVIKDSAIVSVISVQDLTFRGTELMASTYKTYEIWITITLMYFILTYGCSIAVGRVEKYMERKGYV